MIVVEADLHRLSALLGSEKMCEILGMVLVLIVDGVLIVMRPGTTRLGALQLTVEQLRYVGTNVVGIVLNDVDEHSARYGYYYKSYYYKQYKYYRANGKPTLALWALFTTQAKNHTRDRQR